MLPGSKDEKDVEQHGFRFFFLLHFPGNFYITLPAKKVLQHDVTIRIWLTASMFVQLCSVHVGTTYQVSIVFSLYMHTTISYILQPAGVRRLRTPCVTVPLFGISWQGDGKGRHCHHTDSQPRHTRNIVGASSDSYLPWSMATGPPHEFLDHHLWSTAPPRHCTEFGSQSNATFHVWD